MKMKFCWIPPGEAQLGSPKAERQEVIGEDKDKEPEELQAEAEEVRGKYKTKGFWMAKYPVTQEEWTALMGENPSEFVPTQKDVKKADITDTSRFPVERVSWDDCQKFIKKLNEKGIVGLGKGKFRLPHENEWELAARGGLGNKQPFYFGNKLNGTQANCNGDYPYGTDTKGPNLKRTTAVGSYEKAAPHPWGLCDMSGNVYQWCENYYDSEQKRHILRGGSWEHFASYCRRGHPSRVRACRPLLQSHWFSGLFPPGLI